MNKLRRMLLSTFAKKPVEPKFGKMDLIFTGNQWNSIGSKNYSISASRNISYSDDCLVMSSSDSYVKTRMTTSDFTRESTLQVVIESVPSTNQFSNWFRFGTPTGSDFVFGYMTDEVLTQRTPFVLTFLLSDTMPRVVTYLNNKKINEASPGRLLWTSLMLGCGDTSPKTTDLKIRRFRIFNYRIDESEVGEYISDLR